MTHHLVVNNGFLCVHVNKMLATITSVRVLILAQISMAWDELSLLMILCGMARTAYPLARAASSTVLHASQRPYPIVNPTTDDIELHEVLQ